MAQHHDHGDSHGAGGFHGSGGFSRTESFHSRFGGGPVGHFGARDLNAWRGGFWWHGFRGGRLGWWWFTDGFWYWYDAPAYPYPGVVADYYVPGEEYGPDEGPAPDYGPPGGPNSSPSGHPFYYCYKPAGYYPRIPACPSGWRVVPYGNTLPP
jgi:hypothetical protein